MRKCSLLIAGLLAAFVGFAQPQIYLNGFAGYSFDESVYVEGYSGKIKGGMHYGGSVELAIPRASTRFNERTVEITYQTMSTEMRGYLLLAPKTYDINIHYLTLGGNNYFGQNRKAMAFGGAAIGAVWSTNKNNSQSVTKFAFNVKGGGRFMLADNVGLKLYAQLNSAVGGIGGGFYFGTGGTGAGISTYSTFLQFGLGGGLTIGLGGSKPSTRK
ncbi:hypothetical protein [Phnomibacter ginsenosidimutans]|uniref:Porin family protein n=1 Tax=Phnomibacter ginsenosidimutans TaxID=2676868 RepID=A0A6I6GW98_9BACT|nr:hypothetical protein [Phnomibacter ginsenosidimutans]QGW29389.1 hypothetical protein GLV81_15875 [Phnomibacter ginsenosidimutans]